MTVKTKKEPISHVDKLGQPLKEGNYVVGCHRNSMYICRVLKLNKVMIRIQDVKKNTYYSDGWLVYPNETVKLSGEDAVAYILRYA